MLSNKSRELAFNSSCLCTFLEALTDHGWGSRCFAADELAADVPAVRPLGHMR